ncbi:Transcriptional regulatory protein BaeR [Acaryochloris thomasi RCC1774]|uniref:Transcriptional regulatory protein BaeR n=2 Tax=Acaryochloris TaxID=155977 RepID=A0A2W1K2P9_9CYAN|nr:Transcriptional regulatory protein BaeR [Acaryochloris thomasi RCC1774]
MGSQHNVVGGIMNYAAPGRPSQSLSRSRLSSSQVLSNLMGEYPSGRVTFHNPIDQTVGWRVYFGDGQIHFAESTAGQTERLSYLLQQYVPQCELTLPSEPFSDYEFLCQLWRSEQLTVPQFRDLLTLVTQEALIQLLAIPKPKVNFEAQVQLDPLLLSSPLWKLIWPIEPHIDQWSLMHTDMSSAFQRPFIQDWDKLVYFLRYMQGTYCRLSHLTVALKKNLCLYELASRFSMDVKDLAITIHPLIKYGAVGVNPYEGVQTLNQPRVACIDPSQALQSLVRKTLEPAGYSMIPIVNPTKVFTTLAEQPPNLILLGSDLPDIDGYALCRLLRRIEFLSTLPIVILKDRESLIGNFRNRLCGSTTTLSKPVRPDELRALVQELSPSQDDAVANPSQSKALIHA